MIESVNRIDTAFRELKKVRKQGLIAFITPGVPSLSGSKKIMRELPDAGADLIEVGIPCSEAFVDGPTIKEANKKALSNNITLKEVFSLVDDFRKKDSKTPVILMGYYESIFCYEIERFCSCASLSGVDGVIVVGLPAEEKDFFIKTAMKYNLYCISLVAPITEDNILDEVLKNAKGFVYYVSVNGMTGGDPISEKNLGERVERLRKKTDLPIAIGFGVKNRENVGMVNKYADAAVVGSAIVERISRLRENQDVDEVIKFVKKLSGLLPSEEASTCE